MIAVHTPEKLKDMEDDIQVFAEAMMRKLAKNAHKNTPDEEDVSYLVTMMLEEIAEFLKAWKEDAVSDDTLYELADIANFALLINIARKK